MAQQPQKGSQSKERRAPVVLSKNEALYAPSKRAMTITIVAVAIVAALAIASFVLFPPS